MWHKFGKLHLIQQKVIYDSLSPLYIVSIILYF